MNSIKTSKARPRRNINPKAFVDGLLAVTGCSPGVSVHPAELAERLGLGLVQHRESAVIASTWRAWLRPAPERRAGCEIAFVEVSADAHTDIAHPLARYALRTFAGWELEGDSRRDAAYVRVLRQVAAFLRLHHGT